MASPVYAQSSWADSSKDKPITTEQSYILPDLKYHYDESFCDFEIQFPTEPSVTDISASNAEDLKATALSFIQVFDIDKSVRVTANCKEIKKETRRAVSEDSINQELVAIENSKRIQIVNKTNKAIAEDRLRIGIIAGHRKSTPNQGFYVYQIWVSDTSIFTIESEVTGPEYPEADKLLVAILQSFKKKESQTPESQTP